MKEKEIEEKIKKLAIDMASAYGCSVGEAIMRLEQACEVGRYKKPSSDFVNSYRNIEV